MSPFICFFPKNGKLYWAQLAKSRAIRGSPTDENSLAVAKMRTPLWKIDFGITLPEAPSTTDAALPDMTVYTVSASRRDPRFRVSHENRDCVEGLAQVKDDARKSKSTGDPSLVKDVLMTNSGVEFQYANRSSLH